MPGYYCVTAEPRTFQAVVFVYKPLPDEGKACIMAITPVQDELSNLYARKVVHLDDLNVIKHGTLKEFIYSLASCNLEKGTFFSGSIDLRDLPPEIHRAEVHGVVGYTDEDMMVDMTLTSTTDNFSRWTCTYWLNCGRPEWVERK